MGISSVSASTHKRGIPMTHEGFLLSRVLMRFDHDSDAEDLVGELSAAAIAPDGSLWVGADELLSVERLSPVDHNIFAEHTTFALKDYLELFNDEDEMDIEGMAYDGGYLWVTGSHSSKRKKPKDKTTSEDLERLARVAFDDNRYLLGRIPEHGGALLASYQDTQGNALTAASLQKTDRGNVLIDALLEDRHLGPFIDFPLPSKDNGFDIEGMAVKNGRVFLGFRGPVLRGYAVIVEVEPELADAGVLTLKDIGDDAPYRKHFVKLDGFGVRELCFHGDDLLILAGPTMDHDGAQRLFRLHDALELDENSIADEEEDGLEYLFDLPFVAGADKAEGLEIYPVLDDPNAVLVLHDNPHSSRRRGKYELFADVYRLP